MSSSISSMFFENILLYFLELNIVWWMILCLFLILLVIFSFVLKEFVSVLSDVWLIKWGIVRVSGCFVAIARFVVSDNVVMFEYVWIIVIDVFVFLWWYGIYKIMGMVKLYLLKYICSIFMSNTKAFSRCVDDVSFICFIVIDSLFICVYGVCMFGMFKNVRCFIVFCFVFVGVCMSFAKRSRARR